MAISHFGPSNDDFVSLAAFADFDSYSRGETKAAVHVLPQQPSPPTTSDGSPDSSAPVAPMLGDEDEDDDSGSEESSGGKKPHAAGAATSGKRGKASSAERRATHNAIERARRESLNGRFLELANALPTMASVKRPSKSVIVNKSLEWIYESQIREHALVRENNALRAELNDMRARLQMPPLTNPPAMPLASEAARFASGQPTQNHSQLSVPMSPATTNPIDGYFSPAAFPALGALHHPMQHAALASVSTGPASAPLTRQQGFNLANPFDVQQAAGGAGINAQPLSPTSKSDNGSESPVSASQSGAPEVKAEAVTSIGSTSPDGSVAPITVSQADAMAALQAAHFQQQQFAAFAAAAAAASQNRAAQAAPAMAAWPMAGTFLF